MKEWCLKYPGYLLAMVIVIIWGIGDFTSTLKGNSPKPVICFGQCGDSK